MKPLPEQDADLFRQAVEDVTPLKSPNRIAPNRPQSRRTPPTRELTARQVDAPFSDHGAGDIALVEYLRPGLDRMLLRKLRRGIWPIEDELDLHGLNNEEARQHLASFLMHATQQGLRCVNIIHGKGWRSDGRDGLLKVNSRHWLSQHPRVLAFCEPPLNVGGSGAVWVLLKAN